MSQSSDRACRSSAIDRSREGDGKLWNFATSTIFGRQGRSMKKAKVAKSYRSSDMIGGSGEISAISQGPPMLTTSGSLTPRESNPFRTIITRSPGAPKSRSLVDRQIEGRNSKVMLTIESSISGRIEKFQNFRTSPLCRLLENEQSLKVSQP